MYLPNRTKIQPTIQRLSHFGSLSMLQHRQQVIEKAKKIALLQKEAPKVRHLFEPQYGESIAFIDQIAIPADVPGAPEMRFRDVILAIVELKQAGKYALKKSQMAEWFCLSGQDAAALVECFQEKNLFSHTASSCEFIYYNNSHLDLVADILSYPDEDIWLTMKSM